MSYCDIDEYAKVWRVTEPVARKRHRCCECAAPIPPGEKYVRVNAIYDGYADSDAQHIACAEACEAVRDYDDCLPMGGFKEFWSDEGQYLPKRDPKVAKIRTAWAKVLWRERRDTAPTPPAPRETGGKK